MPINVLMPALSPTMTEGNVASWLKNEGDQIAPGDLLCEIETDKATMEVEAVDEGTLGKILVPAGTEGIPVNAVIGVILEDGEDISVLGNIEPDTPAAVAPAASAPAETPQTVSAPVEPATLVTPAAPLAAAPGGRVMASPLARRMAEQSGLDLSTMQGSGPGGRIIKADVATAIVAGTSAAPTPALSAPAPVAPIPATPSSSYEDISISTMRKVIAQRLQESKQQVPHFYLNIDCEIDKLVKVRKDLNRQSDSYKVSVNDFVVRASALSLRQVPACNASWLEGGALRKYHTVDISVAVAIEDGLITPIVRNADHKGLAGISKEVRALAKRARAKPMGLTPEEYQGGTFSISNLGMFGIKNFQAVINPPQAMILAVGEGEQRPVVKDGALAVSTVMSCTLSVDHRVVDGAAAAEFLRVFKGLIEDPMTMLL